MKISDEEINAAWCSWPSARWPDDKKIFMRRVLEAAYAVRKARKKAKREAKPSILDDDQQAAIKKARPVWDGVLEAGKSYQTRNGKKATNLFIGDDFLAANIDGVPYNFYLNGSFSVRISGGNHPLDLIGPWVEPDSK
jgi:hypothetical protein